MWKIWKVQQFNNSYQTDKIYQNDKTLSARKFLVIQNIYMKKYYQFDKKIKNFIKNKLVFYVNDREGEWVYIFGMNSA